MTEVSVTVGDGHRDDMDRVVESLRASGMQVDQVMCPIGVVTGSVPADALGGLRDVEGVDSVDEEFTYRLESPDSAAE